MPFTVERLPRQPEFLYRDVRCDGCGVELKPVGPRVHEDGAWECLQPDDALELQLAAATAWPSTRAVTPGPGELTKLLCGKCTQKLCEVFPAIGATIIRHISSALGHHCAQERAFVWRSSTPCCDCFCECGARGSSFRGREEEADDGEYNWSHCIIECSRCDRVGLAVWRWELTPEHLARVETVEREEAEEMAKEQRRRDVLGALPEEYRGMVSTLEDAVHKAKTNVLSFKHGWVRQDVVTESLHDAVLWGVGVLNTISDVPEHAEARALLAADVEKCRKWAVQFAPKEGS